MCTVSFVPTSEGIVITSNRDEKAIRLRAIPPQNYTINGKNIIFPKDPKAGGTWYAITADGTVLVLLNGAAEKHEEQLHYRKSRGLIVLDIISSASPKDSWKQIDLENIAPFTLVLFQNQQLFQLRWNGFEKETTVLPVTEKHIWSSSTLYPAAIRDQRSDWFYRFLEQNPNALATEMLHFHRNTESQNSQNGLVINRENGLKTMSITQSVIQQNKVAILHCDLIAKENFATTFITV